MKKTFLAVLYCICPLHLLCAQVQNGSFEDTNGTFVNGGGGYQDLGTGSTAIPGWTVSDTTISWIKNGLQTFADTSFGSFYLDLTGPQDNGNFGGVSQTLSLVSGGTYSFSLSFIVNTSNPNFAGTKSVTVKIGSTITQTLTFAAPTNTGTVTDTETFNFIAPASSAVLNIRGLSAGTGTHALFVDNASVSLISVPEPSSAAALFVGLVLLVGWSLLQRRVDRVCELNATTPDR